MLVTKRGFTGGNSGKESTCQSRKHRDTGSITGSGRSPGVGNSTPLQYSCLENSMGKGAWWATVHGATKSDVTERLNTHTTKGLFKKHSPVKKAWLKYIYIYINKYLTDSTKKKNLKALCNFI